MKSHYKKSLMFTCCVFVGVASQTVYGQPQKDELDCHEAAKLSLQKALEYNTGDKKSKKQIREAQIACGQARAFKESLSLQTRPMVLGSEKEDFHTALKKRDLVDAYNAGTMSSEDKKAVKAWVQAKQHSDWAVIADNDLAVGPLRGYFDGRGWKGEMRRGNRAYVKKALARTDACFEEIKHLANKYTEAK